MPSIGSMFARTSLGVLDISRPPPRHEPESDTRRRTPDQGDQGIPDVFNVTTGGLSDNLFTQGTVANGDEAGVSSGMVSNMITGPDRPILGSAKTMAGTAPSSRLAPQTGQAGHQSWRPFAQFRPLMLD